MLSLIILSYRTNSSIHESVSQSNVAWNSSVKSNVEYQRGAYTVTTGNSDQWPWCRSAGYNVNR